MFLDTCNLILGVFKVADVPRSDALIVGRDEVRRSTVLCDDVFTSKVSSAHSSPTKRLKSSEHRWANCHGKGGAPEMIPEPGASHASPRQVISASCSSTNTGQVSSERCEERMMFVVSLPLPAAPNMARNLRMRTARPMIRTIVTT